MHKNLSKIASISFSVFLCLGLFSIPTSAQEGAEGHRGLVINIPGQVDLTFEYEGNPGDTFEGEFVAIHEFNDPNVKAKYFTMATDAEYNPETGSISYPGNLISNHKYSLQPWFTFEQESIEVDKLGQRVPVKFSFTIPEDAAPGTHYGSLLLSSVKVQEFLNQDELDNDFEDSGAGILSRHGPNIIVTVSGDQEIKPLIIDFDAYDIDEKKPWFFGIFEYPPINLIANIKNDGNVFFRPGGNIFIHKGDLTNPIATYKFNPQAGRVLPDANAIFKQNWNEGSVKHTYIEREGEMRKTVEVDWGKIFSDFKFGKYNATLKLAYRNIEGEFQVQEQTISFWIIPWKIILTILLIGTLYYAYKKYKKKQEERKNKKPSKSSVKGAGDILKSKSKEKKKKKA